MAEVAYQASRHPVRAYNSVWQLRVDTWSSIADVTKRLSDATLPQDQRAAMEGDLGQLLNLVAPVETYWAHPGPQRIGELRKLLAARQYEPASLTVDAILRRLIGDPAPADLGVPPTRADDQRAGQPASEELRRVRPSFEVLVVGDLTGQEADRLRAELRRLQRPEDMFGYELVFVPSFEDALVAVQLNFNLQACIIRPELRLRSQVDLHDIHHFLPQMDKGIEQRSLVDRVRLLGEGIAELRPELDLYLVGHAAIEAIAGELGQMFNRVFLKQDALEMHLSILRGLANRYQTPFFTALREYSRQPTGVFHALPISRGKSVVNSPWISDMAEFYGLNIFLAETSATSGGLDSLLEPVGPIKKAQELAGRAFGAQRTYFVTNGTSTANKIVLQSIVTPGEIVLVDRDCHKSHHYALMLAGAQVNYLDAYPLDRYSIYGAVPLSTIKRQLLAYRRAGRLNQVKLLALTNCTFDGIVYDVERVMEECLAIKPDLVFLWDEAWFAFAGFHPVYRGRTAMAAARRLRHRYRDPEYQRRYAQQAAELAEAGDDEAWLRTRLLPDPAKVRLRVYATQSTHKTLTALRQGSMIHIFDQDFGHRNEEAFREAYMTHTSTSPNYQILASLDLGRRQVELEGFELVQKQVELAMVLREAVSNHPLLNRYFQILTTTDLIPIDYRESGIEAPIRGGLQRMREAWSHDEFVLDPSRVTLHIGLTGVDGDTFKHAYLMDRYGIQVNKTSRNTVLFMTNIGTTRSSVAYLIEVLVMLAHELEDEIERMGPIVRRAHERRVASLTSQPPPLPDFSAFHRCFRGDPEGTTPEGDLRRAFFLAYDDRRCEYVTAQQAWERVSDGREVVSATFVIPYPPGFPILVPGQVFSRDILAFMRALDTREIHGYLSDIGYRVFTEEALASGSEAASVSVTPVPDA
jgi:arginine/lysine/ornithine decarboxylase